MVTAKQVINSTKPKIIKVPSGPTQLGSAGYDNPRDDIEKVKKIREGSVEKVPALDNDITNKKYVDDQFPVTHESTTDKNSNITYQHITTTQEAAFDAHIIDNSQAHSDYLINNGNDVTTGTLQATNFGGGVAPNTKFGVYGYSSSAVNGAGAIYGFGLASGSATTNFGVKSTFYGANSASASATGYGGKFDTYDYRNTVDVGKTNTLVGGGFIVGDIGSRVYASTGTRYMRAGQFQILNAAGDWSNNPAVNTYGLYVVGIPTGYGTNHKHLAIYSAGGNVEINNGNVDVDGAISSGTATITASSDNTDVSGINTLFINPAAAVTIGGFAGGVNGQVLHVIIVDGDQTVTLENEEATGTQKLAMHESSDETLTSARGGFTFVYNSTTGFWHDVSHARHV